MKIIDPHVHLFNLELGDYNWLKPNNQPYWPDKNLINKSFNIDDIKLELPLSLAGFVHIEAGFDNDKPWREIKWLEQNINIPFRSIAGADITLVPHVFIELIDILTAYSSVIGIRHIFERDIVSETAYQHISANLNYLSQQNLIFETQINSCNKSATDFCMMAKSHPQLTFILNHAHFCPLEKNSIRKWTNNIERIASHENVFIKASGWEMVSRDYTVEHIKLVLDILLKFFSIDRVMLASNFPLTLFSKNYQTLWENYLALTYSPCNLKKLIYNNAKQVYQLNI